MKIQVIVAIVIGVALGTCGTYMAMLEFVASAQADRGKAVEKLNDEDNDDPFANPTESGSDPFALDERGDWLSKLSGNWVSADGQQSAELDYRTLRFSDTIDWPDISNRYFLIGNEMQFMTNRGYYNISTLYTEPDEMCFLKEDLKTGDLTSFTLYREGTPRARSRRPLVEKTPPPKVQELLDVIPTIKPEEKRDSVMKRLGLADDKMLELLGGERSREEHDLIFSLGIDNEWMLRLEFSVDISDAEYSERYYSPFPNCARICR